MDPAKYEYQSEFARRYVNQGRAEGAREALAKVIVRQLETRFGALPHRARSRVESADVADLERWAERLLTATALDDVFED